MTDFAQTMWSQFANYVEQVKDVTELANSATTIVQTDELAESLRRLSLELGVVKGLWAEAFITIPPNMKIFRDDAEVLSVFLTTNGMGRDAYETLSPTVRGTRISGLTFKKTSVGDLAILQDLPHLTQMNFINSRVSDWKELGTITTLRDIQVSELITAMLPTITQMTQLERISSSYAKVSSLAIFQGLGNLRSLTLQNSQITDLSPAVRLTRLEELDLAQGSLEKLDGLERHPALTTINIRGCKVRDLRPLMNIPKLATVYLDHTQRDRNGNVTSFLEARGVKFNI